MSLWAGQSVGLVSKPQSAADIVLKLWNKLIQFFGDCRDDRWQMRRFDRLPLTPVFLILPIDAQQYRFASITNELLRLRKASGDQRIVTVAGPQAHTLAVALDDPLNRD
jgi:hypothetical protein